MNNQNNPDNQNHNSFPKYTSSYGALEKGETRFSLRNTNLQRNAAEAASSLENMTQNITNNIITALEFGAKDGGTSRYFLERYPTMNLKCIDIDTESLKLAEQNLKYTNRVKFENIDFLKYNQNNTEDKMYDLVFGVFVTHNFEDSIKKLFLEKSCELLRTGGLLVLGDIMLYDHDDKNSDEWIKDYAMLEELPPEDKNWWVKHFNDYDKKYSQHAKWYLSQMTDSTKKTNFVSAKIDYRDGLWAVITAQK